MHTHMHTHKIKKVVRRKGKRGRSDSYCPECCGFSGLLLGMGWPEGGAWR